MGIELRLKIAFLIAFLVMAANATVPFVSAFWAEEHQGRLHRSEHKIEFLNNWLSLVIDAETSQRGFVITGNEEFLAPYIDSIQKLDNMLPQLRNKVGDLFFEEKYLRQIATYSKLRLDHLAVIISVRREKGFEAAREIVSEAKGKHYMDQVRYATEKLIRLENDYNKKIQQEMNKRVKWSEYFILLSTLLNMLLLAITLFYLFSTLKERKAIAHSYQLSTESLNAGVIELEQRNREILLIGQMARALQSQISLKETFSIISLYYSKLLPFSSGVIYLFHNSGNLLEKEADWGTPNLAEECIVPDACWALRRGQPHLPPQNLDLPCLHYNGGSSQHTRLCLPLMAQGEVLGLIYVEMLIANHSLDKKVEELATSISEQVALALSNAKLRKVLQEQSILDPLTNMFNRRYLEETLRREVARARRQNTTLSVIVLDVDHFKKINDSIGHDAGDTVLKSVAETIRSRARESDVPCRYGGEEFVLILSDCNAEAAFKKAEDMAEGLRCLELKYSGHPIGRVTASFGVSTFPLDGDSPELLIQAADRAMYFGKKNGRDQVIAASKVPDKKINDTSD